MMPALATRDIVRSVCCGKPTLYDYELVKKNKGLIYCPNCDVCFSLTQAILLENGVIIDEDDDGTDDIDDDNLEDTDG